MNPKKPLPTEFAPAERAPTETVQQQFEQIHQLPFVREFLDAIPNMSLVLNHERQIVYANRAFLQFLGKESFDDLIGKRQGEALHCINLFTPLGMRPGEAIDCIHANVSEGGCGTTLFCRNCGAVRSILNSQASHELNTEECSMIRNDDEISKALDLRVWSKPINIDGYEFTVFSVMDISDEKRRRVLERIFFHDVMNTAGGMQGLANILAASDLIEPELNEITGLLCGASADLIEEIETQRTISFAEIGELQPHVGPLNTLDLLHTVRKQYLNHEVAKNKTTMVSESAESIGFNSDYHLLRRVLINLVKNALEASIDGDTVTLCCRKSAENLEFCVHNDAVMPLDIQLQIFNRSFSTKGTNRGIGTYSIKLLTERYLKGKVAFISSVETGTIFKIIMPIHPPID